jgi:hypothetical protein
VGVAGEVCMDMDGRTLAINRGWGPGNRGLVRRVHTWWWLLPCWQVIAGQQRSKDAAAGAGTESRGYAGS